MRKHASHCHVQDDDVCMHTCRVGAFDVPVSVAALLICIVCAGVCRGQFIQTRGEEETCHTMHMKLEIILTGRSGA